jgi:hypothetical protein
MPVAQLGLEFLGAIRDPLLQDLVQTLGAPLGPGGFEVRRDDLSF